MRGGHFFSALCLPIRGCGSSGPALMDQTKDQARVQSIRVGLVFVRYDGVKGE